MYFLQEKFTGHTSVMSADGTIIITCNEKGTLTCYEYMYSNYQNKLTAKSGVELPVKECATLFLSHNKLTLAIVPELTQSIFLYHIQARKLILMGEVETTSTTISLSENGQILFVALNGQILLYSLHINNIQIVSAITGFIGDLLLTTDMYDTLIVGEKFTNKIIHYKKKSKKWDDVVKSKTIPLPIQDVNKMTCNHKFIVMEKDDAIVLHECTTMKEISYILNIECIAVSHDGFYIAIATNDTLFIHVSEKGKFIQKEIFKYQFPNPISSLHINNTGRCAIVNMNNGKCMLFHRFAAESHPGT